jgi:hypothetical protein
MTVWVLAKHPPLVDSRKNRETPKKQTTGKNHFGGGCIDGVPCRY